MGVVGYFTAEIGLWSELHTYSGGLGVLAGDHVKSAADANIPFLGWSNTAVPQRVRCEPQ